MPAGATINYSDVIHVENKSWSIQNTTGIVSPNKSGTYLFILSGTAGRSNSSTFLVVNGEKTETIFENSGGGSYELKEEYKSSGHG